MSKRTRLWVPEAPGLLLNRTAEGLIEAPPVRMSGHFMCEVGPGLDRGARPRERSGWGRNMIVNAGLNYLTAWSSITAIIGTGSYVGVGTGTSATVATQTTLVAQLGRTNNSDTSVPAAYVPGPPDYFTHNRVLLFTESQVVGAIAELGMFSAGTGGTMFNRQRVVDQNGAETVLNKTDQDQLRVYFQLRVYPPQADWAGQVTLTGLGTVHDFTGRAANADTGNGWGNYPWAYFGDTTQLRTRSYESNVLSSRSGGGAMSTTTASANSATLSTYVADTFYRDYEATWEASNGNYQTGIGRVVDWAGNSNGGLFQFSFAQQIMKTNLRRLKLTFRRSWAPYP